MIYGKRLRLRAVERQDLIAFQRWVNDPEVTAGLLIDWPLSMADEEDWFTATRQRPKYEQPLVIEVQSEGEWLAIGNVSLININWTVRSAEIGIMIGEKTFWNQGYGSEAMQTLINWAFSRLNLNRIYLHVYETNPRAIRAYQKIGFVQDGRLRQAHYADGRYWDVFIMSVLRSDWQQKE